MTLAELSQDLVWAAATALTLALVAFAIDLTRLAGRVDVEQADARERTTDRAEVLASAGAPSASPTDRTRRERPRARPPPTRRSRRARRATSASR